MTDLAHLFDQIEHDLGFNDCNMQRNRPYNGQSHTETGIRGATEIKGVTFRDLRDCFIRAVLLSTGGEYYPDAKLKDKMKALYDEAKKGENAALCENDLYGFDFDKIDPMVVARHLGCEIEKIMGIFPNVPKLNREILVLPWPEPGDEE